VGVCSALPDLVSGGFAAARVFSAISILCALRWLVRSGAHWRMMPNDLPPWPVVYQQMQRWIRAGCFEMMVEDLRLLLREFAGHKPQPSAMVIDSRTLQSTPESGARAGYDGAKRRKGSKVHVAVDNTLGHLLALHVTAANEQDRAQVERLAQQVQQITGETVELAFVDQGYTGDAPNKRLLNRAFNCRWSSSPSPNAALCCCLAAG
jgi:transposase